MDRAMLLFVHGWATDSWAWEPIANEFGERAISINLPGHGGKGAWNEPTLAPAVSEISARVKEFGRANIIGVGWSLGAQALLAAQKELNRFSALVLAGSTPCFVEKEDFPWGQSKALVKRMIMDMKKDPAATVNRFYSLNFTEEELKTKTARTFIDRYSYPGPISCEGETPGCFPSFKYDEITKALEALYLTDLREDLKTISIPVLLAHGDKDAVCPVGAAQYSGHRIKEARLETFENAGHAPFLTNPELFTAFLRDFIESIA